MEFEISCLANTRKFGKAFRRLLSKLELLEVTMAKELGEVTDVKRVAFYLIEDEPLDHLIVNSRGKKKAYIEIHSGVDKILPYTLDSDEQFLANIKNSLSKVKDLLKK